MCRMQLFLFFLFILRSKRVHRKIVSFLILPRQRRIYPRQIFLQKPHEFTRCSWKLRGSLIEKKTQLQENFDRFSRWKLRSRAKFEQEGTTTFAGENNLIRFASFLSCLLSETGWLLSIYPREIRLTAINGRWSGVLLMFCRGSIQRPRINRQRIINENK